MKFCISIFVSLLVLQSVATTPSARAEVIIDFEDLTLASNSFYNGDTGESNSEGWQSGNTFFNNTFTISVFGGVEFRSWRGWSYSNVTDSTTAGFGNQYAALPGGGASLAGQTIPGTNYAVGFGNGGFFNLPSLHSIQSVSLTNTTYAGLAMLNGDSFAKQFGGATGNDADFFSVTFSGFSGLDLAGASTGSVEFLLADYRFSDNSLDYIIDQWTDLDLTTLGAARSVGISFASSDLGDFGINTPTYIAIDNLRLTAIPEPATWGVLGLLAAFFGGYRLHKDRNTSPA